MINPLKISEMLTQASHMQEEVQRKLEMTVVEGIKTSIPLHLKILADPEFIAGTLSTSFIERFLARQRSGRLAEAV